MLNKIAALVMTLVVFSIVFVSFPSNHVEAAKNLKVDYITALVLKEPVIEVNPSSTTIKTKAIVNDQKVLIIEKIRIVASKSSGIWISGFKVAGEHQRAIGYHHFRIVNLDTLEVIYARSWEVDNKGNVKTNGKSYPEVTYVKNEE